jgi:enoyl-CoA hydratase/carnithine racemase
VSSSAEEPAVSELIEVEFPAEGVAVLTLNDPERSNRLSWAAVDRLASRLAEVRGTGTRVCVLASAVAEHWFEHACLRDLRGMVTGDATSGSGVGWFLAQQELTSPEMISIAAISGDCSGGGAELAWACDLRVAEEPVGFSQPEILMDLSTGIGGTARLSRLIGRTATAEIVLDGSQMSAQRMYELGGVNRVVASGRARGVAIEWAQKLATRSPQAVAALKEVLGATESLPLARALEREQELFQEVVGSPRGIAGIERVAARLEAGESMRDVYRDLAKVEDGG